MQVPPPGRARPPVPLVLLLAALAAAEGCADRPRVAGNRRAASDRVRFVVEIADPAAGRAHVRAEVPAGVLAGRPVLAFEIPDLARGHATLVSIRASRPLGREGDRFELHVDAAKPVTLEYVIDPTFYPPGEPERDSDARSRITAERAVVRTTSLFPSFEALSAGATVTFTLPDGWTVVAPWPEGAPAVYERGAGWGSTVEYIGLGPFEVETLRHDGATFRVGTPPATRGPPASRVAAILEAAIALLGGPPPGEGPWSVVVVPESFMRGGAAGRTSVVQLPEPATLAHEILHWWNHAGATATEAAWFREGFTEYYGVKAAIEAGAWTGGEAEACLADLEAEMRFLERDGPESLGEASRAYRTDARARRLTYSKGAMLALHLDRKLRREGTGLGAFVSEALRGSKRRPGTEELVELFDRLYPTHAGMLAKYVQRPEPLPDLGLGDATGRSGCARYPP